MRQVSKKAGPLLGAHCSTAGGIENAPRIAGRLDCRTLQLFTGPNQRWQAPKLSAQSIEAYARESEAAGIQVAVAHASYLINLAAPDAEIFRKSLKAMEGELARAELLGLSCVILHPGSHRGQGMAWGISRIAAAIDRILSKTKTSQVRIALETTAGQGFSIGHDFSQLAAIIEQVEQQERIGVCFDTCHAFAAGYDFRRELGYRKMWQSFEEQIGIDRLLAMHLNDSKGELGSHRDRHEHIGKGQIGLSGFRLLMNDRRFDGIPMLLETPKEESAVRLDSANLRRLRRLIRRA